MKPDEPQRPDSPIQRILDLARWAPSGDNTQPWRFEPAGDRALVVHARDTRDWCLYDLQGRASQLAVGALIETVALAASREGLSVQVRRRSESPENAPIIDLEFEDAQGHSCDPLAGYIRKRVTQRRSLSRAPLKPAHRACLEQSLPPDYSVVWIETPEDKRRMARLLFRNAGIRLTIPEAYRVHKRVIEWKARYSEDKIPDQAVGLDPTALLLMRWAMKSWERVRFLNKYLAGTLIPRFQLDYLPAVNCAAHFVLTAAREPTDIDDFIAAGRALQRFWLAAASVGLQFQPEVTPLIFSGYARRGIRFAENDAARREAVTLCLELEGLLGASNATRAVFAGRVGYGRDPKARSLRRPLASLMDPLHLVERKAR